MASATARVPSQRCDVPFYQNWAKHNRWQRSAGRVDWACFIPSSCASLYTKREQTFYLRLCWLCVFWHICCFNSPKVGDGSACYQSSAASSFVSTFNTVWISEFSYSWKKTLKSSLAHLWKAYIDFLLEGWLMQKCREELSPWIPWENSEFGLALQGYPRWAVLACSFFLLVITHPLAV